MRFQAALRAVLEGLVRQDEEARDAAIAPIWPHLQAMIRHGLETFSLEVLFPWNQLIEAAVCRTYSDLDESARDHLVFLCQHADFLERHLEPLFHRFEGLFTCADKTRWVMQQYAAQCVTGAHPPWPTAVRRYWHPKTQSLSFWFAVCGHIKQLYGGNPDPFLGNLQVLAQ